MSLLLSKNYGSSVTKFKTSVANFVLFLLSLWIVGGSLCNMFLSQGGGRTTAMLPSLRPDLLSRLPRPVPLPKSPSLSSSRPAVSVPCSPLSPPPPTPSLRPPAQPFYLLFPLVCLLVPSRVAVPPAPVRCAPSSPTCCCTVDNGKEEE